MLDFDANEPFPLIGQSAYTLREAQDHAEAVDKWLGIEVKAIEDAYREKGLSLQKSEASPQQRWLGLSPRAMLTPYTEIRQILEQISPRSGETVMDLGAGYGRMGFVIGRHYPEVKFVGYEIVEERVAAAKHALKNWDYPLVRIESADLTKEDFKLEYANYYFLYDFGTRRAIQKILEDLREIAKSNPVVVIARGGISRDMIHKTQAWLAEVVPPQHFENYSIYRSAISV